MTVLVAGRSQHIPEPNERFLPRSAPARPAAPPSIEDRPRKPSVPRVAVYLLAVSLAGFLLALLALVAVILWVL